MSSIKIAIMRIRWTGENDGFEVYSMPDNPRDDVADDARVYARGACVDGQVQWHPNADLGEDQLRQISDKIEAHLARGRGAPE